METNTAFHKYEEELDRLIRRIKGETIEYNTKQTTNYKCFDITIIPQRNRELLLGAIKSSQRTGNSIPRTIAKARKLLYVFLLFGSKEIEKATPQDFQDVVDQIITNKKLGGISKRERIEELKRFDKEFFGSGENYTERTKKIKAPKSKEDSLLPEEIITEKEANRIINATISIRDRAFMSTIWTTGARIGEMGNIKVKHFQPTERGNEANLILYGKTGMRRVLLVEGVQDIKDWLATHPDKGKNGFQESFMFTKSNGKPLTYSGASKIIRESMKRANVKKKMNPHSWRHARATFLCSKGLPEAQMRQYFGWAKGSDIPSVYTHLSQRNMDSALKKALGLEDTHEEEIRCRVCGSINKPQETVCVRCNNPITLEGSIQLNQQNKVLERLLTLERSINNKVLEMVRAGYKVDEAESQSIELVAQDLFKEREKHTTNNISKF